MSITVQFILPSITCVNCVRPAEKALRRNRLLKIESVSTDVTEYRIAITVDDHEKTVPQIKAILRNIIESVGVQCMDVIDEPLDGQIDQPEHKPQQQTSRHSHLSQGVLGILTGVGVMAFTMSGLNLPVTVMYGLLAGSYLLTGLLGADSYYDAGKNFIKSRTLTMDSLFAVSTITLMTVSIASFFYPVFPMMMEGGLLIFGFRHLGKAVEESLKKKMFADLSFKNRAAKTISLQVTDDNIDKWVTHPSHLVKPDDTIIVQKGQIIPVDGICLNEKPTSIYNTIITGSSLPVKIQKDEKILAGMKVPDDVSFIKIKVTHPLSESYLARFDEQILKANAEKAPIESATNKMLQYFVPGIFALAALSGAVMSVFFNPTIAIQCAISVLVSACPCTLGLITPYAIKIGMSKAFEHGVQFKDGKSLQSADQIDTVIFDLNGTLTTGIPKVSHYRILGNHDTTEKDFFRLLAFIEGRSQHPIGKSIYQFARTKINDQTKINDEPIGEVTDLDLSNHSGIQAKIAQERILIGNQNYMLKNGIDTTAANQIINNHKSQQIVYLAKENKLLGYLILKDPIRKDVKQTIAELQRKKMDVHLLTGADQETAEQYARKCGIPKNNVKGNCVSVKNNTNDSAKTTYIESLQKLGRRVAMVGDSANDALALAQCFGIAIKSNGGDLITQREAGAIIDNASLLPVVTTFAVAKETVSSIKQNLLISLAYNACSMLLAGGALAAVGLTLNPGICVAMMAVQASLILLNQYRIKQRKLPHLETANNSETVEKSQSSYQQFHQQGIFSTNRLAKTVKENLNDTRLQKKDFSECTLSSPTPKLNMQEEQQIKCCPS